ncbi:MAG: histidine phosphatase family protein [Nitrospiraceae bacterium]|nr:histidine phosphatase family protein [Nitrospiraceae bacterium]
MPNRSKSGCEQAWANAYAKLFGADRRAGPYYCGAGLRRFQRHDRLARAPSRQSEYPVRRHQRRSLQDPRWRSDLGEVPHLQLQAGHDPGRGPPVPCDRLRRHRGRRRVQKPGRRSALAPAQRGIERARFLRQPIRLSSGPERNHLSRDDGGRVSHGRRRAHLGRADGGHEGSPYRRDAGDGSEGPARPLRRHNRRRLSQPRQRRVLAQGQPRPDPRGGAGRLACVGRQHARGGPRGLEHRVRRHDQRPVQDDESRRLVDADRAVPARSIHQQPGRPSDATRHPVCRRARRRAEKRGWRADLAGHERRAGDIEYPDARHESPRSPTPVRGHERQRLVSFNRRRRHVDSCTADGKHITAVSALSEHMPTILLVRHGETDWNRSGRIMGIRPVPLNQNGLTQSARLALQLTALPAPVLYSSPVVRARQTADILASTLHVPVIEEPGLSEIGVGEWEGRHWNEFDGDPARVNFYRLPQEARPPGGETLGEVQQRAIAAVERARARMKAGTAVLVTHADVIRTIVAHYLETDIQTMRHMQIGHASVTALEIAGSSGTLLCLNSLPDLGWLQ